MLLRPPEPRKNCGNNENSKSPSNLLKTMIIRPLASPTFSEANKKLVKIIKTNQPGILQNCLESHKNNDKSIFQPAQKPKKIKEML